MELCYHFPISLRACKRTTYLYFHVVYLATISVFRPFSADDGNQGRWEGQDCSTFRILAKYISLHNILTFRGPCILIYSRNKRQQDAPFLKFIRINLRNGASHWLLL